MQSTQYNSDKKIKAFELINQMKREFSEINEDLSVLRNIQYLLISKGYDRYTLASPSSDFLKMKLASNSA